MHETGAQLKAEMTRTVLLAMVRLRYQLVWAQTRSGTGRAALLFALYLVGTAVFLFLSLGGIGAAIAGIRLGGGLQVARAILAGLFVTGLVSGLVLGAGPRSAFSDAVLRRYPMTPLGRLAGRHCIGLLDPIWPLLLAVTMGLALGFSLGNPLRLLAGLPAAALYVSLIYLATVTLLSLVDRLLQHRAGATILGFLLSLIAVTMAFVHPFLTTHQDRDWLAAIDRTLRFLPPGAAASVIAGAGLGEQIFDSAALIGWCLLLVYILFILERRPAVSISDRRTGIVWENPFDKAGILFGGRLGPLVAKALRYYLRSNQVRFGLAVVIPFVVFFPKILPHQGGPEKDYLTTLALFFIVGFVSTGPVAMNMFGSDGAGIRRYAILPVPFDWALHAWSAAALLLGGMMIPPALIVYVAFSNASSNPHMLLLLALSAVAGLFYFNALGLWTTILSPFSVDSRTMLGNRAPFHVTLIQVVSFQPCMVAMLYLRENGSLALIGNYGWLLASAVVLCAALYAASLHLTGRLVLSRRERLTTSIAGSKST